MHDPFIDPRLFRSISFSSAAVVSLLTGYAFATAIIGGAVFVDRVLYGGPDEQRLALGALAGATAVGALVSGLLVRFVSLRLITLVGLLLSVGGLIAMASWTPATELDIGRHRARGFGFGFGLTVTPRSTAAVEAAGRRSFGVASAVVTVARMLGMAVGLAILTAYGSTTIDRLAQQVYATPDAYLQFIPEDLRDRPLRDPLVVNALEEWASREAARIMVGLFVVAAGVTAVAIPPGLLLGAVARHSRVCWTTPRPRTAPHVRPTGPRPLEPTPMASNRPNPASRSDRPARAYLPAERVHPASTTGKPGAVRIAVMEADACRESEGATALDGLPEILALPNAAVWVDLVSPTTEQTRQAAERTEPPSAHRRGRPRGKPARQDPGGRRRRPHRAVRPSVRRGRSSPPRSISSSGRGFCSRSMTGAGIRATRTISGAVSARSSSEGRTISCGRSRTTSSMATSRSPTTWATRSTTSRTGWSRRRRPTSSSRCSSSSESSSKSGVPSVPVREVFNQLTNRDEALIDPEELVYFRDIYDHVIRLTDELDNYRELTASTLDVYLTQVNNSLSVIMKRLTGVTVILAGIGAVAGIFGMSEAGTALGGKEAGGFWMVTAIVIALAVGAAVILRRIDWI